MRRIDMFCYKHPHFGINNLMLYIIGANALVYLLMLMDRSGAIFLFLMFDAHAIFLGGQLWRLVTFVFIPSAANLLWLAIELYFYYFVSNTLQTTWGKGRFTIYYLVGVLVHIIYGTIVGFLGYGILNITLNGLFLNLSMLLAFATLYPDTRVLLFFVIPIKVKWIGIANFAYFVYVVLRSIIAGLPNLLPFAALINYLIFCGGWIPGFLGIKSKTQRANTINYKTAAKKYHRQQAKQAYTRKCEVCGRTDADSPGLEFRFCSKCGGYHCFCMDHINSHVHFKE
jgi:hypothetical protein